MRLASVLLLCGMAASAQEPGQVKTSSTVVYRARQGQPWTTFGYYTSQGSARRVFQHLARAGNYHEVELRISNRPVPVLPPRPPSVSLPVEETCSLAKANEVFRWLSRQKDIAYRYPIDGCYARAHLMCERMAKQGFKPRKVWAAANGEELYAKTKNHPRGYVTWAYHVAPALRVRIPDGTQRWFVLDPSLHEEPATLTQWETAMMRTATGPKPYVTVTKLGEGPVWVDKKRKPGTGYWPGPDPKDGVNQHAMETMKKYKPWEGKDSPKGVAMVEPDEYGAWVIISANDTDGGNHRR